MHENFNKLDIEKQQKIINAGYEVFAKHGYKNATTNEIVSLAGISKGALFHYFGNKERFYFYLYEEGVRFLSSELAEDESIHVSDFFERINNISYSKLRVMKRYPYVYAFFAKGYIEDAPSIKLELTTRLMDVASNQDILTKGIDMTRFRKSVDIYLLSSVIVNFAVEYLQTRFIRNPDEDMETVIKDFQVYLNMLKDNFYKEEFL